MAENKCDDAADTSHGAAGDDNQNIEKRAAVYGLTGKDLQEASLVVAPGKHVIIDGEAIKQRGVVNLTPKSIDDVKRWIGVPDDTAAKGTCCSQIKGSIPGVSSAADVRKLDPALRRNLRAVADSYVNGDSRKVVAFKPMLEHLVDRASIVGIFLRQDIDIHRGAKLEIARNNRILFARHIRIWTGGQLILRGNTKIDCVTITGGVEFTIADVITSSLAIGRYVNLEAAHG